MELMTEQYRQIVEPCIAFARQFLDLPSQVELCFEDCPSRMFPQATNASETNGQEIYFNKQWFLERINDHRDDLEFFAFHELRHCHQIRSIQKMNKGLPTQDSNEVVQLWQQNYNGYVRNEDARTEQRNVLQEIEIDANAYGIVLSNLLHISDDKELYFSPPEYAMRPAFARAKEYYESEPKVVAYLERFRNPQPRRVQKYERNKPCPCGSGKKWKKCTCKEYHEDY